MNFILILIWFMAMQVSSAQQMNTPADAFDAGKDFANTGKGTAGHTVDSKTGRQQLPYYGTTAPETDHFQGGKNLIGSVGTQKQITCQAHRASTAWAQQPCDAVNFLSKNPTTRPQYKIDKKTDPILTASKKGIDHPGTIPGQTAQGCHIEQIKHPATWITETCTESQTLETVRCRRGFSAQVGSVVDTQSFDVNRGAEVPPWTAQTFAMNFHVKGKPEGFKITWYQIDNYGQVWVNGVKVYENVLPGHDDMRWGRIGFCSDGRWGSCYHHSSGSVLGRFYDDNCNWGCRGTAPHLDITRHIKEGNNEIILVCANAQGIGPCSVKITGTAKKLVLLGSLIDNQCSTLEQRGQE